MTSEMKLIVDTCNKKGFDCYIEGERIHIKSKHDRWIIMNDLKNGKPTLYHRNKGFTTCSLDSPILFYHLQSQAPHTYHGILKYIVNHDKYANHTIVIQTKWLPEKKNKKDWSRKKNHSIDNQSLKRERKGNGKRNRIERINTKEMIMDSIYDGD